LETSGRATEEARGVGEGVNTSRRFWTLDEEKIVSKTAELFRTLVAVLYSARTRFEVGPVSEPMRFDITMPFGLRCDATTLMNS